MREMTAFEIAEARFVFNSALDYSRIRIAEGVLWPDRLAQISAWLGQYAAPTHNAITLGNKLYFPVTLRTIPSSADGFSLDDAAWLVHELTHAWQFQHQGITYLLEAIRAQVTLGPSAYDYGWEAGLNEATVRGDSLYDFNPEQQGDIARHYYYRHKQDLDVQAWLPFALTFKNP